MEVNKRLRAAKYGYIILSVLTFALGIVIITKPDVPFTMLRLIGGILLILLAGVKLIGYLSKDRYRLAFQFDLAFGIISLIMGLTLILKQSLITDTVSILLGLLILTDSLLKIQISIDSREFGISKWWLVLIIAIVTAAFGLLLMAITFENHAVLMLLLGIALVSEGALNLATVLTAVNILQKKITYIIE